VTFSSETHTKTQTASPLQQLVHERATMLRYTRTYIVCLVYQYCRY